MHTYPMPPAGLAGVLLVALYVPLCAAAEQNPIVVTATRIATPESEVGSSVTVISAEEIRRRQYKTVAEALRMVPGLDVVQAGGPGQQTSVFIRGASSSHTLVLMDGINIADPSNPIGAVDFSSLLLDNVERIEVVRGPQSTLYGANAIGGVINIITRKGEGRPRATLSLQGGNHTSYYQQLAVLGSQDRVDYSVSGTHLKTHASSVTPEALRNGLPSEADHYRNSTLSARLGLAATETLDFSLLGRYINDKQQIDPEVGFGTIEDPNSELKNREYFLRGESRAALLDGRWDASAAVSYTDYNRRNNNPRSDPSETLQHTRFQGDTLEFSLDNDVYLNEAHTLTLGGGTKKESMNNDGFSDFGGFVISELSRASERTNYAYAQDQFSFAKRVFGTAGLRLDDRDDFGTELTYRVTGVYRYQPTATRFTGSLGTGFRAPSLFELFGFTPNNFGSAYRGNPDLEPEKNVAWELGVEQALATDRVKVGATYFRNDIKNLIETVFDPAFNSTPENINKVHLSGVETFVSTEIGARLSMRIDYTFTDAEVSDNSDRPLLRRPRKKASADINYTPTDKTGLYLGVDYVGKRKDIDRTTAAVIDARDYTVFNGALTYQVRPAFRLEARVNNILDANYEPADGFQALGRNYLLGFTASL
ncbi:MAG: TonB-dependent receptor plug domain-containing protein [Thiogranum sp.]